MKPQQRRRKNEKKIKKKIEYFILFHNFILLLNDKSFKLMDATNSGSL